MTSRVNPWGPNRWVGGGSGKYDWSSPSTVTVGNLPSGTNLTDRTFTSILEEMLVSSIDPSISVSVSPNNSLREFGDDVTNPTIIWTASLGAWPAGTLSKIEFFRGNTGGTLIHTDNSPSPWVGSDFQDTFVVSSNQQYTVRVTDSEARTDTASRTYNFTYPYFWGTVSGGGKPTANQALINSWTKVVANSNGTITINFSSASNDWLRFATPATSNTKTTWYENALNNGNIGSPSDLFGALSTVSIDSPTSLWSGVNYKIYISNFQSAAGTLELRN